MQLQRYFEGDPFVAFYNLDGLSTVVLTTDIDWAPDYATAELLELVAAEGFCITAFATHDSPLLRAAGDFVEVGLHPDNTRPDPNLRFARKILDLKDLYPESVGLRCHRNFFGQNISDLAKSAGITYDISTFLWQQPFAQCHLDYNGLVKMSYVWEDGIHADLGLPLEINLLKLDQPGLKILNVHPILVYLNAPDDNFRRNALRGIDDLTGVPASRLQPLVYRGYGFRDFYRDLLRHFRSRGVTAVHANSIAAASKG